MPMLLIVTPCKSILVGGTGLKVLLSLHLLKITFFKYKKFITVGCCIFLPHLLYIVQVRMYVYKIKQ